MKANIKHKPVRTVLNLPQQTSAINPLNGYSVLTNASMAYGRQSLADMLMSGDIGCVSTNTNNEDGCFGWKAEVFTRT